MLAHGEATKDMNQFEYLGNIILLTIGGNDTTRNTISGSIYALNKFPDQYAKLRANPDLIPSMVSETIRWQTPLAHMKRVATQDYELGGKTIKKGDNRRHVVRLGQPRRHGHRAAQRLHHRPRAAAPAPVLRLRHPPLRGQPPGRAAAEDHLGRDPQALPRHPGARRAAAGPLDLRQGLQEHAGVIPRKL